VTAKRTSVVRARLAVLLALACFSARADARAQPHKAEARELYQRAMRHYELGEFAVAIDEFKRAYEISAAPGLLFNLGQVYRMKKDYPQALHFYRTYLRLQPNASNRAIVESLIAELQASVTERQRTARPPPPPEPTTPTTTTPVAPPPPPVVTTAPPPPATTPATTPPPPVLPPVAVAPRPTRWRLELWLGGAGAALGLGTLATGIALGVRANSDADQLSRASAQGGQTWDSGRQALYRDGQRSATAATVLYAVGGALVAAGALVGALGLHERGRARRLAVVPAPDGMGLACAF
jgi:hypothetical protein